MLVLPTALFESLSLVVLMVTIAQQPIQNQRNRQQDARGLSSLVVSSTKKKNYRFACEDEVFALPPKFFSLYCEHRITRADRWHWR